MEKCHPQGLEIGENTCENMYKKRDISNYKEAELLIKSKINLHSLREVS